MGLEGMNGKIIIGACLLAVLVTVVVAYVILTSPSETLLYVDPQTVYGTNGQNVTISIKISNVVDLYGWTFKLEWNASLLDWVSFDEGTFFKSAGTPFLTYNTTDQSLVVYCTLEGKIPGVNGTGTLAIIGFKAKDSGACDLNLYDVELLNSNETAIDCAVHGGHFRP
jgi:hypothetical protein